MTTPRAFSEAEKFAWLQLARSENVGPKTFDSLLARFGSATAALQNLPDLARKRGWSRPLKVIDAGEIEREIDAAARHHATWFCRDEIGYPKLLREIPSAPPVIAVRGRTDLLDRPAVAIVGSRNASANGLGFTERLASALGQAGYMIVSGFARGIDSRAHRASAQTGTIAVLAGGHDRIYPADQESFLESLLDRGAVVSEMPFGWEARGRDFPRRNRLISGLALGLVVVEAARRSGSLITARFAAEQGRDVFAVPGSPLDPRAEGPNDLLRDGAIFCTEADDVIRALAEGQGRSPTEPDLFADQATPDANVYWDEFDFDGKGLEERAGPSPVRAPEPESAVAPPFAGLERLRSSQSDASPLERVVERLGPTPISIDELARSAELPVQEVRGVMLQLEIDGRIERHGGGLVSLIMQ